MKKFIYLILLSLLAPYVSAKEKGAIQILCKPNVKVFLNNIYKGKSREKLNGYLFKNLDYGTYNIELEFQDLKEEFSVELNDTLYTYTSWYFTREEDKQKLMDSDPVSMSTDEEFIPVDIFPELIDRKEIQLPDQYTSDTIKGVASMKAFVDENGVATEVLIQVSSGNALIDSLAVEAGKHNKYLPGFYKKRPIGCWINYKISYPKGYSSTPNQNANYPAEDESIDVDTFPEMISQGKPEYPRAAKLSGITGVVWVKCLVGKDGNVKRSQVGKSSGIPSLDNAAVKASYNNKFKPGMKNNKPIAVWVTYKVHFDIDN